MINFDDFAGGNKKTENLNWLYIPEHPFIALLIRDSELGKKNTLLNLVTLQVDDDHDIIVKVYLYFKYPMKQNIIILLKTCRNWS